MAKKDYDVIIIGAGLVGSTLACKLALDNSKLNIAIVEARKFEPSYSKDIFDPRVVALTKSSQSLLNEISVWESIEKIRMCPYRHMHVWESCGTGEINFDCRDINEPSLGYIVENSMIIEAALERIQQYKNIRYINPIRVSALNSPMVGEKASIILDNGKTLRAPLIVAADGANSPIREMAHLESREWDYGHTALITTIRTELSHDYCARQCFTEIGPLAFLPLQTHSMNSRFCSIVWSIDNEKIEAIKCLSDKKLAKTMKEYFGKYSGSIKITGERFYLPLTQRHCKAYFKPGIVTVGDAAHTIHPLAGQGVNLGFKDIAVLAEEIHRACLRNIPLEDISILKRYQRRRKGPNLAMMATMEGFKHLFSRDELPARWLRNEGMRQINQLELLKNRIIREAMDA